MTYDFETLVVSEPRPYLLHVEINRPSKRNSMNDKFWVEFRECFERIREDTRARVVIVSGKAITVNQRRKARDGLLPLASMVVRTYEAKHRSRHHGTSFISKERARYTPSPFTPHKIYPPSVAWLVEEMSCNGVRSTCPPLRQSLPSGHWEEGDHFSAGLDIAESTNLGRVEKTTQDVARRAFLIRNVAKAMQASINAVERCPQPVVAAVHGFCIGAGVDLICACDVRLCSADANFSVAEARLGLAADLGTLQRMPRIVGNESLCRELAYTGRTFDAAEAAGMGLVSRVLAPKSGREEVVEASLRLATDIARNSPVAVSGTKSNILYGRDHSVEDGMEYNVTWNMSALQTEDLGRAMRAGLKKGGMPPKFSKL